MKTRAYLETKVNDWPAFVTYDYWPPSYPRITGMGFGDAEPGDEPEIDIVSITGDEGQCIIKYVRDDDFCRIESECMDAGLSGRAAA